MGGHPKPNRVEQKHHRPHQDQKQRRVTGIPHPTGEPNRHCEKQAADLAGSARHRPEPHKAERACYRDPCADVAVDQHNDNLHNRWQERERHRKAPGAGSLPKMQPGDCIPKQEGSGCAEQHSRKGNPRLQNRLEEQIRHRQRPLSTSAAYRGTADSRRHIWKKRSDRLSGPPADVPSKAALPPAA